MKNTNLVSKALLLLAIPALFSCEGKDTDVNNPVNDNEAELITVLNMTFINQTTQDTTTAVFSDSDGPGGNPPIITPIILHYSGDDVVYKAEIEVLDTSNPNDIDNITLEIEEEADAHQFFYIPNTEAAQIVDISYDPQAETDSNANPIGISTLWNVSGISSDGESVTIILRHQPNKNAAGVTDGDVTNAGGETDIEVTFQLQVQP